MSDPAAHHDSGKPAVAELDPTFIEAMGAVMTYGKIKYPDDPDGRPNWWKGGKYRGFIASILRHTLALLRGEDYDDCPSWEPLGKCAGGQTQYCPEHSRIHHAAHIAIDAMFLFSWHRRRVGTDDRLS